LEKINLLSLDPSFQIVEISFFQVMISVCVAGLLGHFVRLLYQRFSRSLSNKEYFSDVFVLLAITTTLVITVVKFSLALSLGLVGALSIVRFRAAIKEPEELVYLFLIIAVGIACGAGQIFIAFGVVILIALILFGQRYISIRKLRSNGKKSIEINSVNVLTVCLKTNDDERYLGIDALMEPLFAYCDFIELTHLSKSNSDFRYSFIVKPTGQNTLNDIDLILAGLSPSVSYTWAAARNLSE